MRYAVYLDPLEELLGVAGDLLPRLREDLLPLLLLLPEIIDNNEHNKRTLKDHKEKIINIFALFKWDINFNT